MPHRADIPSYSPHTPLPQKSNDAGSDKGGKKKKKAGSQDGTGAEGEEGEDGKKKESERKVTLKDLIDAGLLAPGPDVLVIDYKEMRFRGNLLEDVSSGGRGYALSFVLVFLQPCTNALGSCSNPLRLLDDPAASLRFFFPSQ
jgi:hypothetical protein